jgi:hypothetical protein
MHQNDGLSKYSEIVINVAYYRLDRNLFISIIKIQSTINNVAPLRQLKLIFTTFLSAPKDQFGSLMSTFEGQKCVQVQFQWNEWVKPSNWLLISFKLSDDGRFPKHRFQFIYD